MGPKITCKITVRKAGIHGRVGKLASRTLFDIGSDTLTYIFTLQLNTTPYTPQLTRISCSTHTRNIYIYIYIYIYK